MISFKNDREFLNGPEIELFWSAVQLNATQLFPSVWCKE